MPLFSRSAQARFWIAVASADHVRNGRAQGFMQVCHGKRGPLARISPGDGVVYYSPTERFGASAKYRRFTALGFVRPGSPYQVDMGGGFMPFRRDVEWLPVSETAMEPLLETLAFSAGKRNWGSALRFGLCEIVEGDFEVLKGRMVANVPHERRKEKEPSESLR
jgi:hypothetical protein